MAASDDELEPGEHHFGHGFDRDVCEGCPHKNAQAEGVKARAAQAVGQLAGQDTCGICGCTLLMLSIVSGGSPPVGCPRLDQHEGK